MVTLLTAKAAQAIDLRARKLYGISTLVLMENAGSRLAAETLRAYRGRKRIACFCGKGNNGGDGLVACRHLLSFGIQPDIFLAGTFSQVQNEAKANLTILRNLKQAIVPLTEANLPSVDFSPYGLIIDALLGVGLSGEVGGMYRQIIERINASKAYIISADIPSGLDATTGKVLGVCVKADMTVTFMAKKRGMVIKAGPRYCGKIIVADLGIRFPGF